MVYGNCLGLGDNADICADRWVSSTAKAAILFRGPRKAVNFPGGRAGRPNASTFMGRNLLPGAGGEAQGGEQEATRIEIDAELRGLCDDATKFWAGIPERMWLFARLAAGRAVNPGAERNRVDQCQRPSL